MNAPLQHYLATITSARQLTLPTQRCERLGIKRGDKLAVTVERGVIILPPLRMLIADAAGSRAPASSNTNPPRPNAAPHAEGCTTQVSARAMVR